MMLRNKLCITYFIYNHQVYNYNYTDIYWIIIIISIIEWKVIE